MEEKIINMAFANLEKHTGIKGNFTTSNNEQDGKVELIFPDGRKEFFIAEVKKEIRNHQLLQLIEGNTKTKRTNNLLLIAENIFPKTKEVLRMNNVAWLDIAGNIFLHTDKHHVWIEGHKKIKIQGKELNRAFTATGLKVLYLFLIEENLLNQPYRYIAEEAGVALGNINYIINGLKVQKFLILHDKKRMMLINKAALLQKWMAAYEEKLKTTLHIGNFRFFTNDDYYEWKKWQLEPDKTFWGGEPAGDIMTNYLKPEIFTLYTEEIQNTLMKKYRLIPDPQGKVKVYKKFWKGQQTFNSTVVHPLLAYTDLMNTGDRRCMETAEKIYNELLRNQLQ